MTATPTTGTPAMSDDPDLVDAPRAQAGPNPQHLLTTVLGEYLDSADAELPSVAVVAVLAEFGISEASARAALSRVVKRGLLARRPGSRPPVYHLTAAALARHRSRMHQFLAFGAHPRVGDGAWDTVCFSLPQHLHAQRHAVRRLLGAQGFARLYDTVWIRPRLDGDQARAGVGEDLHALLDGVEGARWSVSVSRFDAAASSLGPAAAYDLDGLAAAYRGFLERYAGLGADVEAGVVNSAQALIARTSIMDSWRRFADLDPDLPAELLPADWPRTAARDLFLRVHSALGSPAQARLVELTLPHWPTAPLWITHYRAADDAAHLPVRAQD